MRRVSKSNIGQYECHGKTKDNLNFLAISVLNMYSKTSIGICINKKIYFSFLLAHRSRTIPKFEKVFFGLSTKIRCTAFYVEWSFERGNLPSNIIVTKEEDTGYSLLIIISANNNNNGKYNCLGKDNDDSNYSYFLSESTILVHRKWSIHFHDIFLFMKISS